MSECCDQNAPAGGCRQGRDCPVNAAHAERTCEALGICQHPEQECTGACEQVPRLPAADGTGELYPWPQFERLAPVRQRLSYWATVTMIAVASLVIVLGVAGYMYARWHP